MSKERTISNSWKISKNYTTSNKKYSHRYYSNSKATRWCINRICPNLVCNSLCNLTLLVKPVVHSKHTRLLTLCLCTQGMGHSVLLCRPLLLGIQCLYMVANNSRSHLASSLFPLEVNPSLTISIGATLLNSNNRCYSNSSNSRFRVSTWLQQQSASHLFRKSQRRISVLLRRVCKRASILMPRGYQTIFSNSNSHQLTGISSREACSNHLPAKCRKTWINSVCKQSNLCCRRNWRKRLNWKSVQLLRSRLHSVGLQPKKTLKWDCSINKCRKRCYSGCTSQKARRRLYSQFLWILSEWGRKRLWCLKVWT